LLAGFGTGFLFGKGKSESKTTSGRTADLPEGAPIGDVSASGLSTDIVAELTLAKKEIIYVKQLQIEVERRAKVQEIPPEVSPLDLRRMVLDAMISERLVLQAAERAGITSSPAELEQQIRNLRDSARRSLSDQEFAEGIEKQYGMSYSVFQTYLREELIRQKYMQQYIVQESDKAKTGDPVSDREINEAIQPYKDQLAARLGHAPTDEEFNSALKQQGGDLAAFRGQARQELTMQKYLIAMGGGMPAEQEIQAYYDRNKANYVRPDTISFDYIGIPFGSSVASEAAAKTRAEELARKIGSNVSVFNVESAAVAVANTSGSARYIPLSVEDPRVQQVYGLDFIDTVMPLAEGKISGVIRGRQGFFIIKITSKFPQANLGLDDAYRLGTPTTVRTVISYELMQEKFSRGGQVVIDTLIRDLRKEGSVTIHEDLLAW
jgi:hypothetical protein